MKHYVENIEETTQKNNTFRTVIHTSKHAQIVVMSLNPNEDIGQEIHPSTDQFIRIESGSGTLSINTEQFQVSDGFAMLIPAGVSHNLTNSSSTTSLKLYTIYTPPHHRDGTIHKTKQDAEADTSDHI